MSKKEILPGFLCGIVLLMLPSMILAAQTGTPFGGDIINSHADNLSQILYGPIAKIAALFGGITGVIIGYLQQSVAKVLTFGGIMLVSAALPTFINGFYSMLLP